MTISELLAVAEEQTEKERQMPSLIEADSPERYISWAATLEILRRMKRRSLPQTLENEH